MHDADAATDTSQTVRLLVSERVESADADEATLPPPQRAKGASLSGDQAESEVPHANSKASASEPSWFKDSFSTPIGELLATGALADKLTVKPGAESTGPVAAARV